MVLYKRDVIIQMLVKQECNVIVSVCNNKEKMETRIPRLFNDIVIKILRTKFLKRGENCNIPDLETLGSLQASTLHGLSVYFMVVTSDQVDSILKLTCL